MKIELYRDEASDATLNAQRNLSWRTHFVDADTLRFHKSRVMSSHVTDGGLLFAVVTSDSLNFENTRRGFRFAIFDVFGTCLQRPELEQAFRTRHQATKAMWAALGETDAHAVTVAGIAQAERNFARDIAELRQAMAAHFKTDAA